MLFGMEFIDLFLFVVFVLLGLIFGKVFSYLGKKLVAKKKSKSKILNIFTTIFSAPEPIVIIILFVFIDAGINFLTVPEISVTYFGNISHVVYVFAVSWIISRFLIGIIDEYIAPRMQKKPSIQFIPAFRTLAAVCVYVFAIILLLTSFGYNITTLLAGIGIGGLALAFAAQKFLENIISGIMLFSDKNFNIGNLIKINGEYGTITEIGLRATNIRTFDGTLIVIPNSMLVNNFFENISYRNKRREFFTIGLVFGTSVKKLEQAKEIIKNILQTQEGVEPDTTIVAFETFNSYSLDIRILYFITELDYTEYLKIKDQVNIRIKKEFEKAKISIAFPTQTIQLKK